MKSLLMTEIPCFVGVLIILTLKEQPKNPSQLLAVPNFIRCKTKYAYSIFVFVLQGKSLTTGPPGKSLAGGFLSTVPPGKPRTT